jgi:hypothetical protein
VTRRIDRERRAHRELPRNRPRGGRKLKAEAAVASLGDQEGDAPRGGRERACALLAGRKGP